MLSRNYTFYLVITYYIGHVDFHIYIYIYILLAIGTFCTLKPYKSMSLYTDVLVKY